MKSLIFTTMCFFVLLHSANGTELHPFSFVGDVVKLFQVNNGFRLGAVKLFFPSQI